MPVGENRDRRAEVDIDPDRRRQGCAAGDRWFLSAALTDYQDRHRLDDAALAAELGCDPAALVRLRLCRMPRPGPAAEEDIAAIAGRSGIDGAALRRVVTEAACGAP
jgi:hypothetical protein